MSSQQKEFFLKLPFHSVFSLTTLPSSTIPISESSVFTLPYNKMAIEISDPRGNVILQTKDVSFRVCPAVMSDSSPFFDAMFHHDFREGLAVRNATPENPATIELHDDDPDVLRIFVRTAHDQIVGVPRVPAIDHINRLAILVDKYDCAPLMTNYGEVLIYRVLETITTMEELWLLLQYAYVLNSQALFNDLSQRLALQLPCALEGWMYPVDVIAPFIPIAEIIDQVDALRDSYMSTIERILAAPYEKGMSCTCFASPSIVGNYWLQLVELDIHPLTPFTVFWEKSPLEIIERTKRLPPAVDAPYIRRCLVCCIRAEILASARLAARMERDLAQGLCVGCVNPGGCEWHPEE